MIDPTLLELAKLVGATIGAGGAAWLGQRGKAKTAAADAASLRDGLARLEGKVDALVERVERVEDAVPPAPPPFRVLRR